MSRQKVKRELLDELDAKHKFTPPPSLVEDEFNNVWKTILDDLQGAAAHLRRRPCGVPGRSGWRSRCRRCRHSAPPDP